MKKFILFVLLSCFTLAFIQIDTTEAKTNFSNEMFISSVDFISSYSQSEFTNYFIENTLLFYPSLEVLKSDFGNIENHYNFCYQYFTKPSDFNLKPLIPNYKNYKGKIKYRHNSSGGKSSLYC